MCLQDNGLSFKIIIIFCISTLSTAVHAQLGFCSGNSGDAIFSEDFGAGTENSMLPDGTTTYSYINGFPDDGFYTVSSGSFGNPFDWHAVEDHTPNDTDGKFLIVNAGVTAGEFYRTTVSGLCETTTYEFSAWLFNLIKIPGFCSNQGIEIPLNVRFQIWDSTDTNLLASGNTGDVFGTVEPTWGEYGLVFQTLANQDTVILKMINNGQGGCGNDLAIDDIEFKTCGDTVIVTDDIDNTVVTICESDTPYSTTLTATPDFAVFSSHFYQWQESIDGNSWTDIAGETNQILNISASTSKFYRTKVAEVAVNLTNDQCLLLSDEFQIDVNADPNAPVNNGDVPFNCNSNEAVLSVNVPTGVTVNWYDSLTGGILLQANALTYTATTAGIYYAEAINNITGCVSSTRTAVTAIPLFPLVPVSDGDVDYNCTLNQAILTVTSASGTTVNWYDAASGGNLLLANNLSYTAIEEGTFYAETVDTSTGCISNSRTAVSTSIFVPDTPVSDGDVSFDCALNAAVLSVSVSTGITVNWYDSQTDGILLLADSTSYSANNQTTYYAEAVDDITGCASLSRTAVSVSGNSGLENCFIPQGISPGVSPGQNDNFDLSNFAVTQLQIYNRYGTLIYSKNDYSNEWEGQTNDGGEVPVGTYFYTMIYEGGSKNRSGWVYVNK
ncbi:gliding motility-associated C-terminal domain-containing protein [Winogradskyella forsetii]|uniref:Ig-like domain-containing protein n=1 Tax=Winogradskyella forsetii TaxID=2686077 RepID=UPI0015B97C4B|nr:gliding motility-associated C-terminal domain-containing protein [Winogradskyella forsetii]